MSRVLIPTPAGCEASDEEQVKATNAPHNFTWARMVEARTTDANSYRYHCVMYREHKGVDIPPVARWRWKADDETVWVYCKAGCCEVHSSM